jgi:hypothetical protein
MAKVGEGRRESAEGGRDVAGPQLAELEEARRRAARLIARNDQVLLEARRLILRLECFGAASDGAER